MRRRRAVARTRDWVNTPPGDLTPPAFADAVVEAAKPRAQGHGHVKVDGRSDDEALAEVGCGGILGVGSGSAARRGWSSSPTSPPKRRGPPRAGRQGHHLRLRRPVDQAGAAHDRR